MDFKASHRFARIGPQKARLVIDMIRGKSVNQALETLQFCDKRAAYMINKVVRSAMANGQDHVDDIDSLYVSSAMVDEGPRLKRHRYRARGRVDQYVHRMCHITVILSTPPEEKPKEEEVTPVEAEKVESND